MVGDRAHRLRGGAVDDVGPDEVAVRVVAKHEIADRDLVGTGPLVADYVGGTGPLVADDVGPAVGIGGDPVCLHRKIGLEAALP